ncbi:rifin PIR protein, putative [Plasmodium reichenowi]|uniref:Rifin PIR protein, putative n=1 Tax=Plasmodium reichenowi TaxID=5854 RepID=A0A2P9DSK3_PLARE|nr:rifin PIR protein, putative [Plasmodium reichenowi]
MKVHYINILLFALPLNILVHNQRNHKSTTPHHTQTNRSLCECELYAPANYDKDPVMKRAMQQFEDRTSQRFHEYDDRMNKNRQKCKEKCDKEIQKIILKDKIDKELTEKFATLQTDIENDAIPTCICEKSMADKVEKNCLLCGGMLSGGIAPSVGLLGAVAIGALKNAALKVAIEEATTKGAAEGLAAGLKEGMNVVTKFLKESFVYDLIPGISEKFSSTSHYANITSLDGYIYTQKSVACSTSSTKATMCKKFNVDFGFYDINDLPKAAPDENPITNVLNDLVAEAKAAAETTEAEVTSTKTAAFKETNMAAVEAATTPYYTPIIASIIAIEVIVLIMVIIYLILRYRRKKKMKKKLQYIKLLEE